MEIICGECKMFFNSKRELHKHVQIDHDKGTGRRADNLFQKLKKIIIPNEPNEEFMCRKCSFDADTVSNFMKNMCSKEMTTIVINRPGVAGAVLQTPP